MLTRRFTHENDSSFDTYPDLIMMDGGRGQVNVCNEVLEKLGINVKVCGMVKDDNHRTRGLYFNKLLIFNNYLVDFIVFLLHVESWRSRIDKVFSIDGMSASGSIPARKESEEVYGTTAKQTDSSDLSGKLWKKILGIVGPDSD